MGCGGLVMLENNVAPEGTTTGRDEAAVETQHTSDIHSMEPILMGIVGEHRSQVWQQKKQKHRPKANKKAMDKNSPKALWTASHR